MGIELAILLIFVAWVIGWMIGFATSQGFRSSSRDSEVANLKNEIGELRKDLSEKDERIQELERPLEEFSDEEQSF